MSSLVNNSYAFGGISGLLIQRFIKEGGKEVPLYFTIAASMITHRILQLIPKAISSGIKTIEKNADLVDRNITTLATPTACMAFLRAHLNQTSPHFVDLIAKIASVTALNHIVIKPTLVYVSPTKNFFNALNHPLTLKTSSSISNSSLVQYIANNPIVQGTKFLTKVSLTTLLVDSIAEPVYNRVSQDLHKYCLGVFAGAAFAGFLHADLLSKFSFNSESPSKEENPIQAEATIVSSPEQVEVSTPSLSTSNDEDLPIAQEMTEEVVIGIPVIDEKTKDSEEFSLQ